MNSAAHVIPTADFRDRDVVLRFLRAQAKRETTDEPGARYRVFCERRHVYHAIDRALLRRALCH